MAGGAVAYTARFYSAATAAVSVAITKAGPNTAVTVPALLAAAPIATLYPVADPAPDPELEALAAAAWDGHASSRA